MSPSRVLEHLARFAPLPLVRLASPRALISLMYHVVSDQPLAHVLPLYPYKNSREFEADLAHIRERYHAVSSTQIEAHAESGDPLPSRAVSVTFDDGFTECFTVARPFLKKLEIPATFFIVDSVVDNRALMFRNEVALCLDAIDNMADGDPAELLREFQRALGWNCKNLGELRAQVDGIDFLNRAISAECCTLLAIDVDDFLATQKPYMTRDQLVEMNSEGFTIGAHTLNHPQLWLLNEIEAEREIVESCAAIRDITGAERVPFAFPFNGLRLDRDFLAGIRSRNPFVGSMYDTNNLMRDRSFIVNRINADIPEGCGGSTNLPLLMRRAHSLEPLRRFRRWKRGSRK